MDIQKAIDLLHDIMVEGFTVGDRIFDMEQDESEAIQTSISGLQELKQYRQIGTVDECRSAREKQIPKEPKRIYKKYGKHKWRRKENGEVDEFAFEYGNHNGVVCEVCGKSVCIHCNPDYDELEDCKEEYYLCPNCGEKVPHFEYCKCGQALKWGD